MGERVPKYRYKCYDCNREWWEWLSISESNRKSCPHCQGPPPQKIPTGFTVISSQIEEKKSAKNNVIEHIEENREILKKMRESSKNEDVLKNG
jgi:putative FmdB family regulatory protein